MSSLSAKLNSRRGASMLIALVFLLAALILGSVVLASASANAGRIGRSVTEQQAYYAVASAAELVKADMAASRITSTSREVTTRYWEEDSFTAPSTSSTGSFTVGSGGKLLYGLKTELGIFYSMPSVALIDEEISLSFAAGEDMPPVGGTLTLYKGGGRDYCIRCQLYVSDGTSRSGLMTLDFIPEIETLNNTEVTLDNDVHTETETNTTTVTWGEPEVTRG